MALSQLVKELILGLMGGDPIRQAEIVDALENADSSIQNPITQDLDFGGFKGTNAANPTNPQDLATRAYVLANAGGSGTISALTGDVTASGSGSVSAIVAFVGGTSASLIASGAGLANSATSTNTINTIVKRDGSGNFSAGTITASLSGNASTATTTTSFSGSLLGDVTGTQGATVVTFVGTSSASLVHSAELLANAATSANTASTIVKRDGSGNFSAGTITANLTGNASGSAGSFTGSLVGDVTGTQGSTVVSFVGGTSASLVASGSALANAATSVSTPNTIVKRDAAAKTHLKGLFLDGSTSGSVSLIAPSAPTSYSLTLPSTQGSSSTVLTNNGSGVLSWEASGGGGGPTVGSQTITAGGTINSDKDTYLLSLPINTPGSIGEYDIQTTLALTVLPSTYWSVQSQDIGYPDGFYIYVWHKVDGIGTDPTPGTSVTFLPNYIGIEVDLLSTDTAIQVAAKEYAAIIAADVTEFMTTSNPSGTDTFTIMALITGGFFASDEGTTGFSFTEIDPGDSDQYTSVSTSNGFAIAPGTTNGQELTIILNLSTGKPQGYYAGDTLTIYDGYSVMFTTGSTYLNGVTKVLQNRNNMSFIWTGETWMEKTENLT